MVGDKDYSDINADVLFEKKLGGGSYFTVEGAYYHFGVNDGTISDSLYALAAFALAHRRGWQRAAVCPFPVEQDQGRYGHQPSNIDVGVAYLIKGLLRLVATYSYTKSAAIDMTTMIPQRHRQPPSSWARRRSSSSRFLIAGDSFKKTINSDPPKDKETRPMNISKNGINGGRPAGHHGDDDDNGRDNVRM